MERSPSAGWRAPAELGALARGERYENGQPGADVAWDLPVPARAVHGFRRAALCQPSHGARRAFGRRNERHPAAGAGRRLDGGPPATGHQGNRVLDSAVWLLWKLGVHHARRNLRHRGPLSHHSGGAQRPALAGEPGDGRFPHRRFGGRPILLAAPLGAARSGVAVTRVSSTPLPSTPYPSTPPSRVGNTQSATYNPQTRFYRAITRVHRVRP